MSKEFLKRWLFTPFLIMVGAVLGSGLIMLVDAQDNPNIIQACVAEDGSDNASVNAQGGRNVGSVRIVENSDECFQGEYPVYWNVIGPYGPQGEPGADGQDAPIPIMEFVGTTLQIDVDADNVFDLAQDLQGPQGEPGVSGYEIVTETRIDAYGSWVLTAFCPDGKSVLGGGARIDPSLNKDVFLATSEPFYDDAWRVVTSILSDIPFEEYQLYDLKVYAICANV